MGEAHHDSGPPAAGGEKRPRGGLIVLVSLLLLVLFLMLGRSIPLGGQERELGSYEAFLQQVEDGNVSELWIYEDKVVGKHPQYYEFEGQRYQRISAPLPETFRTHPEPRKQLIALFAGDPPNPNRLAKIHEVRPNKFLYNFLLPILPWVLLLLFVWFFFFRPIRASGPGSVMAFGRSRARFANPERVKVTFDDVAGIEEAKEEVREIIEYLRAPARFRRLGARVPRGILLVGPPGCGKTLLAKAIAGEARVPFLAVSGSDFVEMFVGVGAARVRDLFKQARDNAPCIVFLDEIDAVGRRRGTGLGGGHDEREQTLNQILVEMDGFSTDESVIVLAATNRPDVLDPALLRPGRFDRHITIDPPDVRGREDILRVHARRVKLAPDVDLSVLARATPMFTGADLESLINEAAIIATMRRKEAISMADLEEARDRVLWGRQRKSRQVEEEDRRVAAVHEAGHAVVALSLPDADPVHKVTIIPRGAMGGATMFLPERERHILSRSRLLAQITVSFGGRAAEEILLGDVSHGAHNDIRAATDLARRMVCEFGMSEELGPVSYLEEEEHIFLGREIARTRDHSERTRETIDREMRRIVDSCYERARQIVRERKADVQRLADGLLRWEVLSASEVRDVLAGKTLDRPEVRPLPPAPESSLRTAAAPVPQIHPGWGEKPLPGPSQA